MAALEEGPYEVRVERIMLEADGEPVDAIDARPKGVPLGGVVVAPDISGVRPLFDDICSRLASHGLAVCAVEPFARIPAGEREKLEATDRLERVKDLYDDVQVGDLAAAADRVCAGEGIREVSVMGFCMGGYYALKAAATGRFSRAVSFYGMLRTPEAWRGPGHRSPLDLAADVCGTLAILGGADPWVPPEDVDALRAAWAPRRDCKIIVYRGADHGFVHDPDRPAHRPDDAADAWRRALGWIFEGEA